MQNDLAGLLVVAVEQAVAAPYATSRLADAGARILKIERPGTGDFARHYDRYVKDQSTHFVWLNRGKESVCIDLKTLDDRRLLETMIGAADVFIQNLKPGALARVGLDSDALRAKFPKLITCDISGFGEDGPRAHLKAYDLIVQAETGLCSITGNPDGPSRVGVSVCDIAAGMNAHAAILQALIARERTGRGRGIKVSLFDSVADWMNVPILQYLYSDKKVERCGVAHPTIAPYAAYTCAGGEKLIFAIQNEREWVQLCEQFLEMPELTIDPRFADNPARVENRKVLDEILADRFRRLIVDQACEALEGIGIAYGRLNELAEAARHPHLRFMDVPTPAGDIKVIAPSAVQCGDGLEVRPVPSLGEHTEAIRLEFAEEVTV